MKRNRRWFGVGVAVVAVGVALAAGVPIATILTIAAVLACPAAMYFGMGMMSRPPAAVQHNGPANSTVQKAQGKVTARSAPAAIPGASVDGAVPLAILKIRLAKGDLSVEEYDRLVARVSASDPVTRKV